MLQIKNITKDYQITKDIAVHALRGVSLNLRNSEFVSVLGPSGCGKTTLLNIIGGLDGYTSGELKIDGRSTANFSASDWDTYRSSTIGFVFQSYNLIPNMNVLDNVSLALSVAGDNRRERLNKAREALCSVGLAGELKKYPNQLSGGQMQRVAIARAIVNNPSVILADEPTGALDSETGVQVMELLKEISRDRLVLVVTHNRDLAEQYSTRIVTMSDGEIKSDTDPYTDGEAEYDVMLAERAREAENTISGGYSAEDGRSRRSRNGKAEPSASRQKKSRLKLSAAFKMSLKNLRVKLGRTLLTSFAGSIGIFGIALVLAISVGMGNYVDRMESEAVGDSAIRLGETAYSVSRVLSVMDEVSGANSDPYPDIDGIIPYQRQSFSTKSVLTDEFIQYVNNVNRSWVKAINYTYSVQMHVLQRSGTGYTQRSNWASYARQMIEEDEIIEENYDVLYKSQASATGFPANYAEVSLVVDIYNHISPSTLNAIGIPYTNADGSYRQVKYSEIVDREYSVVLNDGWYLPQANGTYKAVTSKDFSSIKDENILNIKIVSVLRQKKNGDDWLGSGIAYLPELSEFLVENARNSAVGKAQLAATDHNVLTGKQFTVSIPGEDEEGQLRTQYTNALKDIGAYTVPVNIQIYPKDINSKNNIAGYIEDWNKSHPEAEVAYLDLSQLALSVLSSFIDVVTYVLIAFSAVSLIVSTVMISVITYTSVIERVRVIGILRSIGARKRDITKLFNSETLLLGIFAGVMGVGLALAAGAVGNIIIGKLLGETTIISFTWWIVTGMLALSVGLTLLAGLIPAVIAARKDPVVALRTE